MSELPVETPGVDNPGKCDQNGLKWKEHIMKLA
jgi:hypothetical protein